MFNFRSLRSLLSSSRVARRSPIRRFIGRPIEMLEDRTVPAQLEIVSGSGTGIGVFNDNQEIISIQPGESVQRYLAMGPYLNGGPLVGLAIKESYLGGDGLVAVDAGVFRNDVIPQQVISATAECNSEYKIVADGAEQLGDPVLVYVLLSDIIGGNAPTGMSYSLTGAVTGLGGTIAHIGDSFAISLSAFATVSIPGDFAYGERTSQIRLILAPAPLQETAVINVHSYNGQYDGNAHGISGTATGTHGEDLSSLLNLGPAYIDAGHYAVNWTFAGNSTYRPANGTSTIDISQATPTVVVNPATAVYNGNSHETTGEAFGVNGTDIGPVFITYGGGTPVDAGNCTATGTFSGNQNYTSATGTSTVDISPAPLTINVGNLTKTYGETADLFRLPTSVSTGVNGEDLGISYDSAGVGSHADVLPGGYPITATVYDDTGKIANYAITINSGTLTVDPTTALFDIDPYNDEYDGNAHGLSGTASGIFGEDLSNLFTSFGAVYVDAGHHFEDWNFAGNNNYQAANGTSTIDISRFRAIPSIDSVEPLTYDGLGHGTTGQVVGINGIVLYNTVVYTEGDGNAVDGVPLHAGDYTASISFPGDNNYTFALATTHIVIAKADAVVDVPSLIFQYNGNVHFLTGTATGVQREDLSALLNILSPAIDAGVYSIIWIFRGKIDYKSDSGISFLIIDKAPPTASINAVAPTDYDGHAHGTTGQVVGVNGIVLQRTITYRDDRDNLLNGAPVNAGTYTAKISFSGDNNYLSASASTIIVIGKATPTASIDPVTANYDGQRHGTTGQVVGINGVVLPSTITYRDSQNRVLSGAPVYAGVYTATISFPGNNNYTAASASTTVVILSAKDQLILLIDDVAHLGLSTGNANALTTKLNNALTKLSQGNITAGVNLMQAFINQVGAFAYSGKLSVAQADALIAAANAAIYSATH